jgi:hypothetical protein
MDHQEGQRPWPRNHTGMADGAAFTQPWLRLAEQLLPLIGESGFCALLGRAWRLAAVAEPGLGAGASLRSVAQLLESLNRILNEIGPEHAGRANAALLGTFTALLGSLIGEALTQQLLNAATKGGHTHGQEQK